MSRWQIPVLCAFLITLSACATAPKKDLALERVRSQLAALKADEELAGYATLALGEAERALRSAEQAVGNDMYRFHLVYMAERRIQIARAMAQREQLERSFDVLTTQRNEMLVRASQLETEKARKEAEQARMMFAASVEDAERQRREKEAALERGAESERNASMAIEEAEQAKRLAESRASEVELARREADLASQQVDSLRRQLENLQLRQTESGVVVTLGDVLFESGEVDLAENSQASLAEVVDLLQSEPDKLIRIEGHTDSTGAPSFNMRLSQRRADAVFDLLSTQGIRSSRIRTVGYGMERPVAENSTATGRSKNRRVEIIIAEGEISEG